MSILNSKARNRKRKPARKAQNQDNESSWINDSSEKSTSSSLDQHHHKLNAKIGVLEDFLAGHALAATRKDEMRRDNVLPPPETFLRKQTRRRISALERRHRNEERNAGGLRFLFLFSLACGMVWWLLKAGI